MWYVTCDVLLLGGRRMWAFALGGWRAMRGCICIPMRWARNRAIILSAFVTLILETCSNWGVVGSAIWILGCSVLGCSNVLVGWCIMLVLALVLVLGSEWWSWSSGTVRTWTAILLALVMVSWVVLWSRVTWSEPPSSPISPSPTPIIVYGIAHDKRCLENNVMFFIHLLKTFFMYYLRFWELLMR